ncbi:MAG: sucrase ferredoxin [Micrococcales bacterium]|uniref:sucrase ferredoxin n=1 Tax=Phycicoccus sp. TaxID=1902410 RepID=UPI0019B66DFF|nr:sucrase ferredoxin [Phycicoccus sp.]MBD3783857.1 sucrase ferredoxin [Micrococcales bacterium]HMM96491.1 sucrase ferredoxin [Phycicoccus sp.]
MALTDLSRCSAAARHRREPLGGSAPVASRWLLVEHPGPWARQPLETPPFLGRLGEEIESTCASFGGRALLVRRQGRRGTDPGERHWFAVDTVRRTWLRGTWRTAEDVLAAARALGTPLSASDTDAEPMLLVCTQGTRDACCAVRGRPIVAGLAREWPEEVWECTHLGGHRFSGTLLALPDGACYGYLDAETVTPLVADHLAGRVDGRHLRGVTRWEPAVQAALARVLADHGPAGLADVVPGRVDSEGDVTRVEVLGSGPVPDRVLVEVRSEQVSDWSLSCGAGPKPAVVRRTEVLDAR